jgi:uncharacterized protein YprB with RNaseH-like and TPR domain
MRPQNRRSNSRAAAPRKARLLENTFIHIPGVGAQTERALWDQGCLSWDDFLSGGYSCGSACKEAARRTLEQSRDALAFGEHQFFARKLKMRDSWRAYKAFSDSCAYLDIETHGSDVTIIGLWDGRKFHVLVQGQDLGNFPDLISQYSMIVSFCGISFDLPVLQRRFSNVRFDQIHIDLCPLLRKLGHRGGLKKIERQFGIERDPSIDGLTGYDAVKLWRRHRQLRDDRALEKLVEYNRADCVNLEALAVRSFEKMRFETMDGWR